MSETHKTPVVKITEINKHPNADNLELIPIFGFQVVVRKGQFEIGDLAVYVYPDSIVPERSQFSFVWERDGAGQPREIVPGQPIPEKWRRITVRKFRKEWSEGLLMPVSDFGELFLDEDFKVHLIHNDGEDVSEILGITHWNPPEDQEHTDPSIKQSKTRPRSLKGWIYFLKNWSLRVFSLGLYDPWGNCGGTNEKAPKNTPPIYDVENFKRYTDVFENGEEVVVTEKIHGSNARFVYQGGVLNAGHMFAGSRKLWKKPGSENIWRKVLEINPDIERWCQNNPEYVLYGEVVPTQGGFEYGHTKASPWLYLFDIRTPQGEWVPFHEARNMTAGYDLEWVPLLYNGPFDLEKITPLADGKTKTGASHIREGVVIRTYPERVVRGLGRAQLKIVSNEYLKKEQ
jgi:hypothetical protein